MKNNMAKRAFTLVELLIVIIIIGIVGGGLWLAMGPSDASAKKAACLGNKESIKTAWSFHSFANSLPGDFAKYVNDGEYKNEVDRVTKCPSGGKYTATLTEDGRYKISCGIKGHEDSYINIGNGGTVADGGGTVTPPTEPTEPENPSLPEIGDTIIVDGEEYEIKNYVDSFQNEKFLMFKNDAYIYNGKVYIAIKDKIENKWKVKPNKDDVASKVSADEWFDYCQEEEALKEVTYKTKD